MTSSGQISVGKTETVLFIYKCTAQQNLYSLCAKLLPEGKSYSLTAIFADISRNLFSCTSVKRAHSSFGDHAKVTKKALQIKIYIYVCLTNFFATIIINWDDEE